MPFMYVASSGETVFSNAFLRGDFSKGVQNKVLDLLAIAAANTSQCHPPGQITTVNIHYRAPPPKLWAPQNRQEQLGALLLKSRCTDTSERCKYAGEK